MSADPRLAMIALINKLLDQKLRAKLFRNEVYDISFAVQQAYDLGLAAGVEQERELLNALAQMTTERDAFKLEADQLADALTLCQEDDLFHAKKRNVELKAHVVRLQEERDFILRDLKGWQEIVEKTRKVLGQAYDGEGAEGAANRVIIERDTALKQVYLLEKSRAAGELLWNEDLLRLQDMTAERDALLERTK